LDPECNIKVADFEGPLDLLLYLINRNRLDIADIPIAAVTRQYLDYIGIMQALNVAVAGEYLVMAATLIQIKSRMLLPVPEDDDDDPLLEITGPLRELAAARAMAGELASMPMLGRDHFFSGLATRHPQSGEERLAGEKRDVKKPDYDVSLSDLIKAMERVLARAGDDSILEFSRPEISLEEQMKYVVERLNASGGRIAFSDLFGEYGRRMVIVTFLALLELVRQSAAMLFQQDGSEEIIIMQRQGG
jgi:segregation and condensation protein A